MTDEKKAARQGGPCQNPDPNCSIASHRGNAQFDAIADTIAGQRAGAQFVRDLCDGISAPDAMFIRLQEIAKAPAKLRGFCRALQKFIERRPA